MTFIAATNIDERGLASLISGEIEFRHDDKVFRVDGGYKVVRFGEDGPENADYLGTMEELAADEGIEF